ncbi:hypothetical protein [Streptomyces sp. NPDC001678]|uniref:hypothetical protein n=1 Tax=Streptomyces sp. NPDC001678 TaxID=3364599 RepID=UPI0036869792
MKIDALYQLLTDPSRKGGGDGRWSLPAQLIGGEAGRLITTWIGPGLHLAESSLKRVGDTVVASGRVSLLGLVDHKVSGLVFGLVDKDGRPAPEGTPTLRIPLQLPDTYSLATSFPVLKDTPLAKLGLSGAVFQLSSAGLGVQARHVLAPQGRLREVVDLLREAAAELPITGSISAASGLPGTKDGIQPEIRLRTRGLGVESPKLSFFLCLASRLENKHWQHRVEFAAEAQLTAQTKLLLTADLSTQDKKLLLRTDPASGTGHRSDTLSQWAGGSLDAPLRGLKLGSLVTLSGLEIDLDTRSLRSGLAAAVSNLRLAMALAKKETWSLDGSRLNLTDIAVTAQVAAPLKKAKREVTATASGTVALGSGISLEAKGTFSTKAATFRLAAKEGTSLTALLSAVGVPMNGGSPELRMKTLAADVTVPRGPFAVDAQVDGLWKLNLGSTEAHLTQGALRLTRPEAKGNPAPPVSGKLTAVAQVKPKSGQGNSAGVPQFSATWELPGTFRLAGSVPKLGLPSLVSSLAGPGSLTWPDEFPTIEIAQASLALTVAPGGGNSGGTGGGTNGKGGVYDLRAGGTVSIAGTELVRVVCLARKTGTRTVVAAVLWKPGWTFSLGDLPGCDPMLRKVLGALVFRETGLLIATGPGAQLEWDGQQPPKNLPSKITAGVTFFTQAGFGLALQPVLKAIGVIDFHGIPLSATLAKSLVDTTISLRLGKAPAIGVESFHLDVKPKLLRFALRAEMRLSFRDLTGNLVHLELEAGGALGLSGDLLVTFVIKAAGIGNEQRMEALVRHTGGTDLVKHGPGKPPDNAPAWKDALGIKGLTIEHFWGEIAYLAKSPGLTVGLGGQVRLAARGGGHVLLRLAVSVAIEGPVVKPNAYEFHLEAGGHGDKGVTLAALLGQFTQQNLDNVPLLRDLELRKLMMAVVTVPWENPATKQQWDPGLWVGGDLVVFGYHAVFGVRLSKEGITAFGSIDKPIILVRDVVAFTSAAKNKQGQWTGPRAAIDTTKITSSGGPHKPYLFLDARCTLLGMTSSIKAEADRTGTLHFRWEATQFKVFSEKVICQLDKGAFTGKVGGKLDVRLRITTPVKIAGHTVLPMMDIPVTLAAAVTITTSPAFRFHVGGTLALGKQNIQVDFTLNGLRDWNRLRDEIINYFTRYPKEALAWLFKNVQVWAKLVGEKVIQITEDVARVLKDSFKVAADAAARLLKDAGVAAEQAVKALKEVWGMAKEAIQDALVTVWKLSTEEARKLLDTILKACPVTRAAMTA